ncbi:GspH/FimT family pseudopilin [Chromobacterium alticapitis]|uniref:Type II secretion system protein H n=1 Tax=Chromobacterium alticapitis TaxID=2073169 RepID=A0A2S5DE10_9NEIS|nr:GspH/FimT family pseudopilin [Chromobacterium alticapitis]POZ61294.1 hypothetical protein C2I19_14575 [Chromobacterium alticapitis]
MLAELNGGGMKGDAMGGFSLIETMIAIGVLAILLAMATPSWQAFIQDARLTGLRDNLITALDQARATALADNNVVTVCPYNPAANNSCGANWSAGWAVLEQQGAGQVLLKAQPLTAGGAPTIGSQVTGGSAAIASVSFNPKPPYVAVGQTGDFRVCDSRGAGSALSFNLQTSGYVQIATVAGSTLGGAALSCP